MKLYYAPGACSLADHIAFRETNLEPDLIKVDLQEKTTEDGRNYRDINPKGSVPAVEFDDGEILTENAAILIMTAEKAGALLPAQGLPRYRALEAVAFITTEIHKSFGPLFGGGSESEKAAAKDKIKDKFAHLSKMLDERDFLAGNALSIADCYAFVMTLWADNQEIELPDNVARYRDRLKNRPAFAAALKAEGLDG